MSTLTLYRHPLSGHAHRAELFLSLLGLDAELIDVDLLASAHKSADFLAMNPYGQVPVLQDGDLTISDSNAILVYLASRYDSDGQWLPKDAVLAAQVQQYLSLAASKIANGPATARLITLFGAPLDADKAIELAHSTLQVLEQQLEGREWLVGEQVTLADIANYGYIAHAPEGNVSLAEYVNVRNWLNRIEQLPGFVAMARSRVGLSA